MSDPKTTALASGIWAEELDKDRFYKDAHWAEELREHKVWQKVNAYFEKAEKVVLRGFKHLDCASYLGRLVAIAFCKLF
jgi:hypothetical protein